jgi:hypothetical protein
MFGYIRPLASELKVREFEQFKACYCGLCHSLGKEYGVPARFILNYDFVFLTMLMWDKEAVCKIGLKRCAVSPCRKKCVCISENEFEVSSGLSLILAYWKLNDTVSDEKFFKSMLARAGKFFLKSSYKKAANKFPEFAKCVYEKIEELNAYENSGERSLDKTADTFASILSGAADTVQDINRQRTLRQILYHVGRWIYIIDAIHDLEEDMKNKRYNPIAARFELIDSELTADDKALLDITLSHSENIAISAFGLLENGPWLEIIKNILYLGMGDVRQRVLEGRFQNTKQRLPR